MTQNRLRRCLGQEQNEEGRDWHGMTLEGLVSKSFSVKGLGECGRETEFYLNMMWGHWTVVKE